MPTATRSKLQTVDLLAIILSIFVVGWAGSFMPGGGIIGEGLTGVYQDAGSEIAFIGAILCSLGVLLFVLRHGFTPRIPGLVIICLGLYAMLMGWSCMKAGKDLHRGLARSKNNYTTAKMILLACENFANDHAGQWPATLMVLAPEYLPMEVVERANVGDDEVDGFDYFAPTKSRSLPTKVLVSKTGDFSHRFTVGYSDGNIVLERRPGK